LYKPAALSVGKYQQYIGFNPAQEAQQHIQFYFSVALPNANNHFY
jgi:hypothetical protein